MDCDYPLSSTLHGFDPPTALQRLTTCELAPFLVRHHDERFARLQLTIDATSSTSVIELCTLLNMGPCGPSLTFPRVLCYSRNIAYAEYLSSTL